MPEDDEPMWFGYHHLVLDEDQALCAFDLIGFWKEECKREIAYSMREQGYVPMDSVVTFTRRDLEYAATWVNGRAMGVRAPSEVPADAI